MEFFRLEKLSKIIESNHYPVTTKPHPQVPQPHVV